MIEITLKNNMYLFVKVPDDAYNFSLTKFETHAVINYKRSLTGDAEWSVNIGDLNIELLDYEVISTTKNISEEGARSIVEHKDRIKKAWNSDLSTVFINYNRESNIDLYKEFALESLQSLIQSVGLDVNKNYLILLKK